MTEQGNLYRDGIGERPATPGVGDVGTALFGALMRLLEEKEFEKITVSELCREANVSRMSFYRCYPSKEALLLEHIDALFTSYVQNVLRTQDVSRHSLALGFCAYWKANRGFVEMLINRGLSYFLMEKFTQYLGVMFGTVIFAGGRQQVSRYEVSYHAGGLYLVLVDWARCGFAESPEEMAAIIDDLASSYTVKGLAKVEYGQE